MSINVIGIAGNVSAPSRTSALVRAILEEASQEAGVVTRQIDLVDAAPTLFRALRSNQLDETGQEIVRAVEQADALVVGSPVYRASYTGALKHLFDLVDYRALAGKPVVVAATGGSALHGLMPDVQLRQLFAFFKAFTLPTSIFALETDFENYRLVSPAVRSRIVSAAGELASLLPGKAGEIEKPTAGVDRPVLTTANI